jgi:hypothetical protein
MTSSEPINTTAQEKCVLKMPLRLAERRKMMLGFSCSLAFRLSLAGAACDERMIFIFSALHRAQVIIVRAAL